ncbi:MAG TPA: alkaline phosphatase family protein, partial [Candidatus Saccharimonadales bacterium]|nr:alkaline phosphatase family protein [Candidatus Saccharimonadales bacterium]
PRYPVLIIGLDAADWAVIDPLIDRGELPVLADLKKKGAWGVLRSMQPPLSPLLWTTVATGRPPDEHGIVDFLVRDPSTGADRPITSRFRKVQALWTILTAVGQPSLTVGWWATYPAEHVLGEMATDRVAYSLFQSGQRDDTESAAWPPELASRLGELVVAPQSVTYAEVRAIVDIDEATFRKARALLADPASWSDPVAHLIRILAATRTYHRIALQGLRKHQPPLSLVYYEGIDEVNHRFAQYAPPATRWADPSKIGAFGHAVENFYKLQDRLIGELLAAVSPGTVTIILSDHGFAWGDRRPTDVPPDIEGKPGRWHTMSGILLAAGPTVQPGRLETTPGLLDIAPTVLTLLSLPVSAEMPGKPIGALVARGDLPRPDPAVIASFEPAGGRKPAVEGAAPTAEDASILAHLTALGYIDAGSGQPAAPGVPPGADEDTGTVTGHLNTANSLLARREYARAEPEYRAALAIAPRYVPARLGLAQCLIAGGRKEEGWEEIRSAMTEGPDLDAGTYMKIARFYHDHGQAERGAKVFASLPPRDGLEAARRIALGILLDSAGKKAEAEKSLREGLRLDPAFPEGLQQIYGILTARKDYAGLETLLRKALDARPGSVPAANLLALTLEREGRAPEAVELLESQLGSNPRSLPTLANLAGLHIRLGDDRSALPLLEKAVAIDPHHVESLVNLIVVKGRLGDLQGAREVFESIPAAAQDVRFLNAMGYALYLNERYEEARGLIERSLAARPGQEEAERLLTAIEAATGTSSSSQGPGL